MAKSGVTVGRINYQDNGNWKPFLHIHLYGRAIDATHQKYGEPIVPGHHDGYMPLNESDIASFKEELERLFETEEFSDTSWNLS